MGVRKFLSKGLNNGLLATNVLPNGNFVDTTGWSGTAAVISADNNTLTVTGDGSAAVDAAGDLNIGIRVSGRKYYGSAKVRVTNSSCTKIRLLIAGDGIIDIVNPVINQWYYPSVIFAATVNGNSVISIQSTYADAATANGTVMEVQETLVIDLTATFGAGNELTLQQCNELFSAWFDGTVGFKASVSVDSPLRQL